MTAMRTWRVFENDILCDDQVAAIPWDDDLAQFLVDAANAAELRKHLYGRVAEKVEALLSVYAAENHLKPGESA